MKLLVGNWERKFPDSLDFVFKCPDSSNIKMVAKEVKIRLETWMRIIPCASSPFEMFQMFLREITGDEQVVNIGNREGKTT